MSDGPSAGGRYLEDWRRPAREPAAPSDGEMLETAMKLLDKALRNFKWRTTYSPQEAETLEATVREIEGFLGYKVQALVNRRAAIAAAMKLSPQQST